MNIMRKRRGLPKPPRGEVERFLPVRPSAFALLAVLGESPKTGVEILERLEDIDSRILGPGTLYRLLRELRNDGLIERVHPPAGTEGDDDRHHFHALSALGRGVLDAESERLRRALAVASSGSGR